MKSISPSEPNKSHLKMSGIAHTLLNHTVKISQINWSKARAVIVVWMRWYASWKCNSNYELLKVLSCIVFNSNLFILKGNTHSEHRYVSATLISHQQSTVCWRIIKASLSGTWINLKEGNLAKLHKIYIFFLPNCVCVCLEMHLIVRTPYMPRITVLK